MITGTVNVDYEAIIRLQVQGPTGHAQESTHFLTRASTAF